MKKHFFLTLVIFCASLSFAQISADSRLSVKFTSAQLNSMESSQSKDLKFWNYFLDNSFTIINVGTKALEYPLLSTVVATDFQTNLPFDISNDDPNSSSFNPLKYDVLYRNGESVYYRISSTELIQFLPKKEISKSFSLTL